MKTKNIVRQLEDLKGHAEEMYTNDCEEDNMWKKDISALQGAIAKLEKLKEGKKHTRAKDTKGKPRLSLVPTEVIYAIARVREYGNKKYPYGGKDNWKSVPMEEYRDALYRHLLKELEKPNSLDEESGLKHLDHMACNIAFLLEMANIDVSGVCREEEELDDPAWEFDRRSK